MADVRSVLTRVADQVETVIRGKREVIEQTLTALLAGGHVLLEDVPGVGKTMLAKALARSLGGTFRRIQFTPDLLPGDVTGVTLYEQHTGQFRFRPGPVFANVVLADEINRASPKTQSALLECMEEQTVSADGETHVIAKPFLVIATQNPVEHEGVYPLPESQLDRFLMRLSLGYPERRYERELLLRPPAEDPLEHLEPVTDPATIAECQRQVGRVHCEASVQEYLLDLVESTRHDEHIRLGASPRAALALCAAAKALALLRGRDWARPDDVQELAGPVLAHRLILEARHHANGDGASALVGELVRRLPVP